ncbi:SGNH/GDSL hydrolase family protein [Thalassotalea fonticola]|uniref:SGNH/GDSL hydrolase family protein n=1 Tax=Thalassotalea fonticola TaxID=3065649 RepID=A0ABZ0GR13_9GAMM|nr:SGNH/GDSL hydrolase family protein [Colwelliaceae bacterium S1-1]
MYKKLLVIAVMIFFAATIFSATSLAHAAVEPGSFEEQAAKFKWAAVPQPQLPNVLLIGDSISIGYTLDVRELLKDKANVYRPIKAQGKLPDNAGDTAKGLRQLEHWLSSQNVKKWDVIHFNWGLHDLKRITNGKGIKSNDPSQPSALSIEQYAKNLNAIVKRLKQTGAVIIFATTTPYPAGVTPSRIPEDAQKYNQAAMNIMTKHNVAINDLYTAIKPNLSEYQRPLNVHFNKQGSKFLATKVSDAIKQHLPH